MTPEQAEQCASLLGLAIALFFLAFAACQFIDELKDFIIDRMERRHRKLCERRRDLEQWVQRAKEEIERMKEEEKIEKMRMKGERGQKIS